MITRYDDMMRRYYGGPRQTRKRAEEKKDEDGARRRTGVAERNRTVYTRKGAGRHTCAMKTRCDNMMQRPNAKWNHNPLERSGTKALLICSAIILVIVRFNFRFVNILRRTNLGTEKELVSISFWDRGSSIKNHKSRISWFTSKII